MSVSTLLNAEGQWLLIPAQRSFAHSTKIAKNIYLFDFTYLALVG